MTIVKANNPLLNGGKNRRKNQLKKPRRKNPLRLDMGFKNLIRKSMSDPEKNVASSTDVISVFEMGNTKVLNSLQEIPPILTNIHQFDTELKEAIADGFLTLIYQSAIISYFLFALIDNTDLSSMSALMNNQIFRELLLMKVDGYPPAGEILPEYMDKIHQSNPNAGLHGKATIIREFLSSQ